MFCAVEAYAMRQWDIFEFLSRWFRNPYNFLLTLEACDGIISGSEALQYFQTGERRFRGDDLDIFVPPHGLLTMGRYLRRAGFMFQPASDKHPFFDAAALMSTSMVKNYTGIGHPTRHRSQAYAFSTFDFVRPPPEGQYPRPECLQGRHVQIIAVCGHPVEHIINNFHSSKP